jgi:hypothetical protein
MTPQENTSIIRFTRSNSARIAVRLLGTVVTHLGAWYRRPALIPLGLVMVLLAWLRGILWPKRTEKPEETAASQA